MKVLRRFIHREALLAVGFVTLGFLALFFFFDSDRRVALGRTDGA
jgi:lipopolysaccharide export system permease protein